MSERRRAPNVRFWRIAGAGFVATFVAGAIYAWAIRATGNWDHGLDWEVTLMRRVHVALPGALDEAVLLIPWLGTNLVMIPVLVPLSWWLWVKQKRPQLVVFLWVLTAGNYIAGTLLKFAFVRERPTLWEQRGEFAGPSYPSGHAMAGVSVLAMSAYLLRRELGTRWPYAVWAVFFIATVYSRLYLGVHWPTDIVGGTLAGIVWFVAMFFAFREIRDERRD